MLRATMAVCELRPPTSVTKPVNTLRLNLSMSAGAMSLATRMSGSSPAKSRWPCGGGSSKESPPSRPSAVITRSTTCSRSALRSRRYSSSISSNWRAITSSCDDNAHSAL